MNEYVAKEILTDDAPIMHRFFSEDDESAIDKTLKGKRNFSVVELYNQNTGERIM